MIAALAAWIFLDEQLSAGQIFGILLVLSGIAWVGLERNGQQQGEKRVYLRASFLGWGLPQAKPWDWCWLRTG